MEEQSKHYTAILHAPMEIDLQEHSVREALHYKKDQILTQADWDRGCEAVIKEFLVATKIPYATFDYDETGQG